MDQSAVLPGRLLGKSTRVAVQTLLIPAAVRSGLFYVEQSDVLGRVECLKCKRADVPTGKFDSLESGSHESLRGGVFHVEPLPNKPTGESSLPSSIVLLQRSALV